MYSQAEAMKYLAFVKMFEGASGGGGGRFALNSGALFYEINTSCFLTRVIYDSIDTGHASGWKKTVVRS